MANNFCEIKKCRFAESNVPITIPKFPSGVFHEYVLVVLRVNL